MTNDAQVGAAGDGTSQEAVPPYRANPPAAQDTLDEVADQAAAMDPAVAMVQAELRQLKMRSAAMVDLAIGVTMQTLGHEEYTLPPGAIEAFQALFRVEHRIEHHGATVRVHGAGSTFGAGGPDVIDCANSGTTMRLLAGMLAGGSRPVTLDGDASLRRRPMERVAAPLRALGATVETTGGRPPLRIAPARLHGIEWTLPVPSAQVKSAILLAALRASGETVVHEPLATRDHTERMLGAMGVEVRRVGDAVAMRGGQSLHATPSRSRATRRRRRSSPWPPRWCRGAGSCCATCASIRHATASSASSGAWALGSSSAGGASAAASLAPTWLEVHRDHAPGHGPPAGPHLLRALRGTP